MPTNDFQRLVYLVRVNLADGATVTESKLLTDRVTQRKREVDVCIEGYVGGHFVVVSVECRDHKRIADVSWVDTMKAKHERLPTNALILASRSGFTPEARGAAAGYGIMTFSLSDVDQVDFPALLESTSSLWTKSVTVTAEKVLVRVLPIRTLVGTGTFPVPATASSGRRALPHGSAPRWGVAAPAPRCHRRRER